MYITEIATITYRSGPEWDIRFGRKVRDPNQTTQDGSVKVPALCPEFLIETYLDHQVRIHLSHSVVRLFIHKSTFDRGSNSV